MTWFADLSPYTYRPDRGAEPWPDLPLVNVGWLDAAQPFPTGEPPAGLVEALAALAVTARANQSRGFHFCNLCPTEELNWETHPKGSAEFRVLGVGVVYAAPELLVHYVDEHDYRPPAPFIDAALAAVAG